MLGSAAPTSGTREKQNDKKSDESFPGPCPSPASFLPLVRTAMDPLPSLDSTYGSLVATPCFPYLSLIFQIRRCFRRFDSCCRVSRATRLAFSCSDSPVFPHIDYMEVFVRPPDLPLHLHDDRTVACAQSFYYFRHYSKKDDLWTKGVV